MLFQLVHDAAFGKEACVDNVEVVGKGAKMTKVPAEKA